MSCTSTRPEAGSRRAVAAVVAAVALACAGPAAGAGERPGRDAGGNAMQEIRIEETTVARVGGWRLGVANLWEREYRDATGKTVRGPAGSVSLVAPGASEARTEDVGAGCVLDLGEAGKWDVVEVVPGHGRENGHLLIRRR